MISCYTYKCEIETKELDWDVIRIPLLRIEWKRTQGPETKITTEFKQSKLLWSCFKTPQPKHKQSPFFEPERIRPTPHPRTRNTTTLSPKEPRSTPSLVTALALLSSLDTTVFFTAQKRKGKQELVVGFLFVCARV